MSRTKTLGSYHTSTRYASDTHHIDHSALERELMARSGFTQDNLKAAAHAFDFDSFARLVFKVLPEMEKLRTFANGRYEYLFILDLMRLWEHYRGIVVEYDNEGWPKDFI